MPIPLRPATASDFPAIVTLMNTAFRGAEGWSIEGEYITGERTNTSLLSEEISKGTLYLLATDDATSTLQGCVSLQAILPRKVVPRLPHRPPCSTKRGFGRELLAAAENTPPQTAPA